MSKSSESSVYSGLPLSVSGQVVETTEQSGRKALTSFLKSNVPLSDQKEIVAELKKTQVLKAKQKPQIFSSKQNKKKKTKFLTAKERRALGLYTLPKKGVEYESLKALNKLWQEYISELVDISKWSLGDANIQMRLCRADYHGALVKVTAAKSSTYVGMEGIVIMETRNTFRVVTRDNILKTIPKVNTTFSFRLGDDHVVSLSGSSMIMKPSERAVKKWKNKSPLDF